MEREKIRDLFKDIHQMFTDVLAKAKGAEQDLGCVIITHPELNHAIVVLLDNWSNITASTVMDAVERVLNSDENLPLTEQMEVIIGNISVPSGSGRVHITRLNGPQSSIALKRSMLRVSNEGQLCLATAIGRCFIKLCTIIHLDEWKRVTEKDHPDMNATMKTIKHRIMTQSYCTHLKKKQKTISTENRWH